MNAQIKARLFGKSRAKSQRVAFIKDIDSHIPHRNIEGQAFLVGITGNKRRDPGGIGDVGKIIFRFDAVHDVRPFLPDQA